MQFESISGCYVYGFHVIFITTKVMTIDCNDAVKLRGNIMVHALLDNIMVHALLDDIMVHALLDNIKFFF